MAMSHGTIRSRLCVIFHVDSEQVSFQRDEATGVERVALLLRDAPQVEWVVQDNGRLLQQAATELGIDIEIGADPVRFGGAGTQDDDVDPALLDAMLEEQPIEVDELARGFWFRKEYWATFIVHLVSQSTLPARMDELSGMVMEWTGKRGKRGTRIELAFFGEDFNASELQAELKAVMARNPELKRRFGTVKELSASYLNTNNANILHSESARVSIVMT